MMLPQLFVASKQAEVNEAKRALKGQVSST